MKYPSFVNIPGIKSLGTNGYRFSLYIPFNNNGRELCVILKNPSTASTLSADSTICKVCNVAHKNGYSSVTVYNLFPYRSTLSSGVISFYTSKYYNNIMQVNLNIILAGCIGKDTVFAWGTNTISRRKIYAAMYNNAITSITSIITTNTFYVRKCKCIYNQNVPCRNNNVHHLVRYPLHGLRWHNNSNLKRY